MKIFDGGTVGFEGKIELVRYMDFELKDMSFLTWEVKITRKIEICKFRMQR